MNMKTGAEAKPPPDDSPGVFAPQTTEELLGKFPAERLTGRFLMDLEHGLIWLADRRMLLLQAEWFADLRRELIDRLGVNDARQLLTQLGYRCGVRDALLTLKLNPDMDLIELMYSGRSFHAFQGSVAVVPTAVDVDLANDHYFVEFLWKNSVEAEAQRRTKGTGSTKEPACWMEVGVATGFLTTLLGRQVIVREVECAASGHEHCRCIARFPHEWDDPSGDVAYLAAPGTEGTAAQPSSAPPVEDADEDDEPIVGRSGAFSSALRQLQRVARTDATILLLGESGVGKSALAAHAHRLSPRAGGAFIEVNCAAIPESLLEAELFGVEKGAFTGAHARRAGRFEEADRGTLFLDEIGLLPPSAQGKLLRVLQAHKFERLGSSQTRAVDVRLIVATNLDLVQAVRAGTFRSDLYYRINVFPIDVPPLRERAGDIPLLAERLIRRFCRKYRLPRTGLTPQAYRKLLQYSWPGNIRELENAIERAIILAEPGQLLDSRHFSAVEGGVDSPQALWLSPTGSLGTADLIERGESNEPAGDAESILDEARGDGGATLLDMEKRYVSAVIRSCNGNVAQAAKRLGLTRAQIDYRLKKWGWQ